MSRRRGRGARAARGIARHLPGTGTRPAGRGGRPVLAWRPPCAGGLGAGLWLARARAARAEPAARHDRHAARRPRLRLRLRSPTTPSLDALARRGVRFAAPQSASPLTGPSHATILTGHYPPVHGVRDNVRFPIGDRTPTLAERLQRSGLRDGRLRRRLSRWRPPSASAAASPPSTRACTRPRGPGRGAARRTRSRTPPRRGCAPEARRPFSPGSTSTTRTSPTRPRAAERARFDTPTTARSPSPTRSSAGCSGAVREAGLEPRTLVAVLVRPRRGSGRPRRVDPRPAALRVDAAGPVRARGPRRPGGSRGERAGRDDRRRADAALRCWASRGPRACRAATSARPSLGRPLRSEPLYAESLYGRLNCRWAPLRGLTDGIRSWSTAAATSCSTSRATRVSGPTSRASERDRASRMRACARATRSPRWLPGATAPGP